MLTTENILLLIIENISKNYHVKTCYFLINPSKGSNVIGAEIKNSLINISSTRSMNDQLTRVNLEKQINNLLDEEYFDGLQNHSYVEQNYS